MSGDGEGRLSRWSRLKRADREGQPAPDAPAAPGGRGGAAPVAGRRLVASLPPLAGYDDDPDGGPPIKRAHGLPPAEPAAVDAEDDDETRELTPEEREAVKDLPPIDSLDKDSDFTPFMAENVPEFLRRQALRVLWRSDPVLANLDGLNDYDEDFSLATLVGKALAGAKGAKRARKKAAGKGAEEKEMAEAPETPATDPAATDATTDDDHKVVDAEWNGTDMDEAGDPRVAPKTADGDADDSDPSDGGDRLH